MPDEIWLHIGLPKSGTSSLQKHLLTHREALAGQGVAYVTPKGKTSCNDLAVAMNKSRDDLGKMARELHRAARRSVQRDVLWHEPGRLVQSFARSQG
jgi:hypothetical protein